MCGAMLRKSPQAHTVAHTKVNSHYSALYESIDEYALPF